MLSALALALVLPSTTPTVPVRQIEDPPVRLKLSDDYYTRGDRARVRVKTAEDGYLLVLRADADGRIRILYPLDPDDDGAIRGGKEFEVRGRGDREAFTVDDREGTGTVLAVRSDQPFQFDDFSRGGHWDYRALSAEKAGDDAEATLLDLVERMTQGHYDYDVVSYSVSDRAPAHYYSGWYDPWYYGPYGYPWFGPRFGFGIGIGFGHSHFFGRHRW
jgi:hypothetical protein